MAEARNYEEYRASVLSALGIEDDVNIRYFADYRKALLTKLGIAFTDEDIRNEERFRLKFLEGVSAFGGLSVKTVFGAVASFNDAVYDLNIKSINIGLEYNPEGYTEIKVTRSGVNLLDPTFRRTSGDKNLMYYRGEGNVNIPSLVVKKGVTYTFGYDGANANAMYVSKITSENTREDITVKYGVNKITFTPTEDCNVCFNIYWTNGTDLSVINPTLALGTSLVNYEAYQGETYVAPFERTVYGGSVDIVVGKLISMYDSNGAKLTTPIEYQITPTQVTSLLLNNLWANKGNVTAKYLSK